MNAVGFARLGTSTAAILLSVVFVTLGLFLSGALVRETQHYAHHEGRAITADGMVPGYRRERYFFAHRLWIPTSAVSQAGLVNNLNGGMAWGLFPLPYAATGLSLDQIGWLTAVYPAVWGVGQLFTGALSDRIGCKSLIVGGM